MYKLLNTTNYDFYIAGVEGAICPLELGDLEQFYKSQQWNLSPAFPTFKYFKRTPINIVEHTISNAPSNYGTTYNNGAFYVGATA